MNYDLAKKIIELIHEDKFKMLVKLLGSRKYKIHGFRSLDKVPKQIMYKSIYNDNQAIQLCLETLVPIYIDLEEIENYEEKTPEELISMTTKENALGVLSIMLLKTEKEFDDAVNEFVDSSSLKELLSSEISDVTEEHEPQPDNVILAKDTIDKKNEKFREKYIEKISELKEANLKISELNKIIKQKHLDMEKIQEDVKSKNLKTTEKDNKIEELTQKLNVLVKKEGFQNLKIMEGEKEITNLKQEIENFKITLNLNDSQDNFFGEPKQVFVLGRVSKIIKKIGIEFTIFDTKNYTELIQLSSDVDEIWILEYDITERIMFKIKKDAVCSKKHIRVFANINEFNSYAEVL